MGDIIAVIIVNQSKLLKYTINIQAKSNQEIYDTGVNKENHNN